MLLTVDLFLSDEDASGSEDVPITSDPQLQESPGSDSPEQSVSKTHVKDPRLTSIY